MLQNDDKPISTEQFNKYCYANLRYKIIMYEIQESIKKQL